MLIKIHYNGRRFPRSVHLRGGGKTSFLPERLTLELEEYDALYLLTLNNRLTPDKWEFAIEEIEKQENIPIKEIVTEEFKPSEPLSEKRIIGVKTDKPKLRGRPKKER